MKRFRAMFRSVGWLWALIFAADFALGLFVTWIYFLVVPGLLLGMTYFTMMRYDEDGNRKNT